jgi:hypothetical protein
METMSQETFDNADEYIRSRARLNGGITREQRDRLSRDMPEVLEALDNVRTALGKSTEAYVDSSLYTLRRFHAYSVQTGQRSLPKVYTVRL